LTRGSVHRTSSRLSRTGSADRLFKQNDRPRPPSRTNSDEFLRRPNAGGLGAHMARQTRREDIKEHYRVDDLASVCASRSAASSNTLTMSRRTPRTIGLDGVPPNANDLFPKHVNEKFRKSREFTVNRILNEAKYEQGLGYRAYTRRPSIR
jgi:hypothetical protein